MLGRGRRRRAPDRGLTRLLLVLLGALAFAGDAAACSCVAISPETALAGADGAFVGRLEERRVSGDRATLTFRVEYLVKGFVGERVEVDTATDSAQCGLTPPRDRRIGLLLHRRGDRYEAGLCDQVGAQTLIDAIPAVDERPPIPTLVGGAVAGLLLLGVGLLVQRRRQRRGGLGSRR